MNERNSKLLWQFITETGGLLKDKLPKHPNHPKGRNAYAHIAMSIKIKYKKSYKDIEDSKFNEVKQ